MIELLLSARECYDRVAVSLFFSQMAQMKRNNRCNRDL